MDTIVEKMVDQIIQDSNCRFSEEEKVIIKQPILKIIKNGPFLKEAFDISDKVMETCYDYGYKLFQTGKYREAVKIFETLKEMDLKNPRYTLAVAACYHYLKEYDKAIPNYYICKEIDVFNPLPCFHLYDCLMKINRPQFAAWALAEVIVRSGDNPDYQTIKEKAQLEKENLLQELGIWAERKQGESV